MEISISNRFTRQFSATSFLGAYKAHYDSREMASSNTRHVILRFKITVLSARVVDNMTIVMSGLKNKLAIIYELSEIKIFIRIILNQHRYTIQDDDDGVLHAKSIC